MGRGGVGERVRCGKRGGVGERGRWEEDEVGSEGKVWERGGRKISSYLLCFLLPRPSSLYLVIIQWMKDAQF